MKKVLIIAMLLAISMAGFAQRQKVTVGKDGEMIVNGDTLAYIEKVWLQAVEHHLSVFYKQREQRLAYYHYAAEFYR